MKKQAGFALSILMCCFIAGCQTTKPKPAAIAAPASPAAAPAPPIAPGQSLIQTEARGFSPSAENGRTAIEFALLFSNADAVKSWQVAIASDKGGQRKFSGDGSKLPSTLEWDGKTDSGATAPDGSYTAALSIDYGDAFEAATATSKPFILDSAKPAGSIRLSPALFSPVEPTDRVTISIDASSSLAKLDSWSLEIYDPGGNLFKSFDGKWPTDSVAWDGKGIKGDLVVSAEDYPVVAKLRDEFGNVGLLKSTIPIDIIVIKQADGYRIPNSRVYFKAFTADYRDVAPDLAAQNATRLDRLAETLKKFPGYRIKIMGHAVMIHWDDPALGKIEEDSVLVPLSKARAEAIKHAMADRGLEPAMIETDGVGAADPLVPDSDYANRWQNRRTAIFLVK